MDHQGNQLGQMETQEVHLQSRKKWMDKVREYFPKVDVCCSDGTFARAVVPSGCLLVLVAAVHVLPPHTAPGACASTARDSARLVGHALHEAMVGDVFGRAAVVGDVFGRCFMKLKCLCLDWGFAADVFHDLHEQVITTSSRGRKVLTRVQNIEAAPPSLEKAMKNQKRHIHFAYVPGAGGRWSSSSGRRLEWRVSNEQQHEKEGKVAAGRSFGEQQGAIAREHM